MAQKEAICLTHCKHGTNFRPSPNNKWNKDRKESIAMRVVAGTLHFPPITGISKARRASILRMTHHGN